MGHNPSHPTSRWCLSCRNKGGRVVVVDGVVCVVHVFVVDVVVVVVVSVGGVVVAVVGGNQVAGNPPSGLVP